MPSAQTDGECARATQRDDSQIVCTCVLPFCVHLLRTVSLRLRRVTLDFSAPQLVEVLPTHVPVKWLVFPLMNPSARSRHSSGLGEEQGASHTKNGIFCMSPLDSYGLTPIVWDVMNMEHTQIASRNAMNIASKLHSALLSNGQLHDSLRRSGCPWCSGVL